MYLLSVTIEIALCCNFMSLCVLKPHSKIVILTCCAISELYMILIVNFGRKCFSLFITPNVRYILFAFLSIYRSQYVVSWIVMPRKINCRRHSKCWPSLSYRLTNAILRCGKWNIYLVLFISRLSLFGANHSLMCVSSS